MYYVNREQIEQRLDVLPEIVQVLREVGVWQESSMIERYAQERAIHLAIEIVTDVGSYLIDGFIMRDASSYEDILDIIYGESVIDQELHEIMIQLVRLRKPLVQDYADWNGQAAAQLVESLPVMLESYAVQTRKYLNEQGISKV